MNIGCICPTGTIKNNKSSVSLEGVNAPRTSLTYTVLYTDSYDSSITPLNGSAIGVELIEGSPAFVGKARFKVLDRASQADRKLSGNVMAISSQANHDTFIKSLTVSSEIEIEFNTQLPVEGNVMNLVSGLPMILDNGNVVKVTTTDPEAATAYPVALNMLRFDPKGNAKSAGTIRISAITAIYSRYGLTGIENVAVENAISVYPNPASGSATLAGVAEGTPYEIYSLAGIKVAQGTAPSIDCSALASGLYLVRTATATTRLIVR